MRVLVTGASGRVGANLVHRLVQAQADVTAMVPPGDPQAAKLTAFPTVRVVEADLCDQAAVDAACDGVTHVAHLAAQLVRGDTPVDRFYDVNAFGTLRVLEGALRRGAGLERFVLVSTDGTYRPGDPPAVPLHEDVPQEPADYYGTSKLLGEVILRNHAAQFDIPFSIVRFATVVTPDEAVGMFRLGAWREIFGRARLGRDTNIWQLFREHPNLLELLDAAAGDAPDEAALALVGPDGESWSLHMVDVRDAVSGVHCALTHPAGGEGGAYNVAGPAPTATVDAARLLAEAYGVPRLEVAMPITWRLEMSVDAARTGIGFEAAHDYRGMIETARSEAHAAFIPAKI